MIDNVKRVGVVTLPGSYNYGNRLQCYAVCQIYKHLGYDPTVLVWKKSKLIQLIKRVIKYKWISHEDLMDEARSLRFASFNEHFNQRVVSHPYFLIRREFVYYSVGSDQVWNPRLMWRRRAWFFLKFADRGQRIALSPSIGLDMLDSAGFRMIRNGVRGFNLLSVREQRGAELIKECSNRMATVICDPTLVLSAEEWLSVANDELTPQEPYVLAYILGGNGKIPKDLEDCILSRCNARTVVFLSDSSRDGEVQAGPAEFISLVRNAKHVVTDSFHAAVFSCIFQTPLTILRREGGRSMFSRLQQLVKMFGLESKVYGSPSFDIDLADSYYGVPEAITDERDRFLSYLNRCLTY